MIKKCAWCNAILGEIEPLSDSSITSCCCPNCMIEYFPEETKKIKARQELDFGHLSHFFEKHRELFKYCNFGQSRNCHAVEYPLEPRLAFVTYEHPVGFEVLLACGISQPAGVFDADSYSRWLDYFFLKIKEHLE